MFIRPLLGQLSCIGLGQCDVCYRLGPQHDGRQRRRCGMDLVGRLFVLQIEPDGLHALAAMVVCFLLAGVVTAGGRRSRLSCRGRHGGAVAKDGKADAEGQQER